jgi:hypothetical protein
MDRREEEKEEEPSKLRRKIIVFNNPHEIRFEGREVRMCGDSRDKKEY